MSLTFHSQGQTTDPRLTLLLMPQGYAKKGESIDMEACFSQLTLDVIGKSVFNYDFNALTADSPLIQVREVKEAYFINLHYCEKKSER